VCVCVCVFVRVYPVRGDAPWIVCRVIYIHICIYTHTYSCKYICMKIVRHDSRLPN